MNHEEDRGPEWAFWLLVPTVTLFEAVALSMDVDPKWLVEPDGLRRSGLAWVMFPPAAFTQHLVLARRCIRETLAAAQPRHGEDHVALKVFARWALDLGWPIPAEMRDLVDTNMVSTKSDDADEPHPPSTAAAERECQKWLSGLMRERPNPMTRAQYKAEAREKFGVGTRASDRAWHAAIEETGSDWNKPGPRKSKHRIDTPNNS